MWLRRIADIALTLMLLPTASTTPTSSRTRTSSSSILGVALHAIMKPSLLSQVALGLIHSDGTGALCGERGVIPTVEFSKTWDVLGPFQIGTREAEWGSDPLKFHGGFQNLSPSPTDTYHSSLATNGKVGWTTTPFTQSQSQPAEGKFTVSFPGTVDWDFLRSIYGWSGVQFQAWARGTFVISCPDSNIGNSTVEGKSTVPVDVPVTFHISPTIEYFVNGKSYFGGDMYSYNRAPAVVHLALDTPHTIDIRVTHDIRAFGGGMPPALGITVEAKVAATKSGLVADVGGVIAPDIIENIGVAGEGWVSFPVRNEAKEWISILDVTINPENVTSSNNSTVSIEFTDRSAEAPFRLAPGQSRPLKFRITKLSGSPKQLSLLIRYSYTGGLYKINEIFLPVTLALNTATSQYAPHIFTFLHPSGIVSFAALRPPSKNASCPATSDNKILILLSLHGAGVDVHWGNAQSAYDELPDICAWVLFPQGVTLWSGDDWHNWGWADVEAAIGAIPQWIKSQNWNRQGVDLERWVVTGHSNGGQGTWYALTHHSDKIIAATPLSGYLSIAAYVPYHMWREADPRKTSMISAAMNSYRHELLVDNFVGTPIMQGHGQLDDNVPTFHSRRMALLAHEAGWDTEYKEFPGQGHWWEGVMTDGGLPEFLKYHIEQNPQIPELPDNFSVAVANPADMGARGGIVVHQLRHHDQLGRLNVQRDGDKWVITTKNIRRWQFGKKRAGTDFPKDIQLDGEDFVVVGEGQYFFRAEGGAWEEKSDKEWALVERSRSQSGAMDAITKSNDRFTIVLPPADQMKTFHTELAIEIARNLYQYLAADTEIVDKLESSSSEGNVIFLDGLCGASLVLEHTAIVCKEKTLNVRLEGTIPESIPLEPGTGMISLRPVGNNRLGVVIWGADEDGARAAARLLPLRTGVGQPNVIVVGKEAGWRGVAGALVMGMFDSQWKLTGSVS